MRNGNLDGICILFSVLTLMVKYSNYEQLLWVNHYIMLAELNECNPKTLSDPSEPSDPISIVKTALAESRKRSNTVKKISPNPAENAPEISQAKPEIIPTTITKVELETGRIFSGKVS